MHGRVEAEPVLGARERLAAAVLEPRILDHDAGEALDDGAVLLGVGDEVDARSAVVRLQVEDAHAVGRGELLHHGAIPVLPHVELELEGGVQLEVGADLRAGRDDEAHRPVGAADGGAERAAGLAEREVERRAFERPAAVVGCGVLLRLLRPQLELVEPRGVAGERLRSGELELRRKVVVIRGGVRHVLALAGEPVAGQLDGRRHARPVAAGNGKLAPRERVAVDLNVQACERIPEGHTPIL